MIVDSSPRIRQFYTDVKKHLLLLFVWDLLVTFFYYKMPFTAPVLPLSIFGSVLAIFLGSRVNSAYQRWWEGRTLWGQLVNYSRSLTRISVNLLRKDDAAKALAESIVIRQIAFVHLLRSQLRRIPIDASITSGLDSDLQQAVAASANKANCVLTSIGRSIQHAVNNQWIDTIQQASFEEVLINISNAQGGMERIKNTPLPNQYRIFPEIFTRIFCVMLPIGLVESLGFATPFGSTVAGFMFLVALHIGDDLADPFANTIHDLPLNAICRTIEIDLLQGIGKHAPEPAQADKGILW